MAYVRMKKFTKDKMIFFMPGKEEERKESRRGYWSSVTVNVNTNRIECFTFTLTGADVQDYVRSIEEAALISQQVLINDQENRHRSGSIRGSKALWDILD